MRGYACVAKRNYKKIIYMKLCMERKHKAGETSNTTTKKYKCNDFKDKKSRDRNPDERFFFNSFDS